MIKHCLHWYIGYLVQEIKLAVFNPLNRHARCIPMFAKTDKYFILRDMRFRSNLRLGNCETLVLAINYMR